MQVTEQAATPRILITGATGFVGQALCHVLIGQNFSVRVLLRDLSQAPLIPPGLNAECVQGDLSNVDSLRAACMDRDAVIHLAGVAHVGNGPANQSHKINVEGTRNLVNTAIEQKLSRFILLSSSLAQAAERGAGDVTRYGAEKLAAERLLQDAARGSALSYLILRPVNVYGVGMKGNIARMISLIHRKRLPRLPQLNSRISLLGVKDLAAALLLALNASDITAKTYTVTDGQQYPIVDIEQAIYLALNKQLPRWRTPAVVLYVAAAVAGGLARLWSGGGGISRRTYRNLTMDNLLDNDEICQQLGFRPSTTLYQALPEIVEKIVNPK
jgi:nucleoside-diphosphate-sugar epimerase